jgi:hypothetical protein
LTWLFIENNAALTTLAFPALTSTYYLGIDSNPLLSQCDAFALTATQVNPYYNIFSNGPC